MKKLITASLFTLILLTSTTQAADEGIKVHGHWKFDIYNPDGSFDRKVEFENALSFSGKGLLLTLLNKENTVGKWVIQLRTSSGQAICGTIDDMNPQLVCQAIEVGESADPSYQFANLTYSKNTSSQKFILEGNVKVFGGSLATTFDIGKVSTLFNLCPNNSPNCSSPLDLIPFTEKVLSNGVPVTNGQIVQVTVEISFS